MTDNIIFNIKKSGLDSTLKDKLINYAENLNDNHCPVIFDEKQLMLIFELSETEDIRKYIEKETNRYTIQKRDGTQREVVD